MRRGPINIQNILLLSCLIFTSLLATFSIIQYYFNPWLLIFSVLLAISYVLLSRGEWEIPQFILWILIPLLLLNITQRLTENVVGSLILLLSAIVIRPQTRTFFKTQRVSFVLAFVLTTIVLIDIFLLIESKGKVNRTLIFRHTGVEGTFFILLYITLLFTDEILPKRLSFFYKASFLLAVLYCIIAANRTVLLAIITAIMLTAMVLLHRQKILFLRLCAILLALLIGIGILFSFKAKSTAGRSLVYKIVLQNVRNIGWDGVGHGNFKTAYFHWQSDYFASGKGTKEDEKIADAVSYSFSGFLQLITEYGVIGIVFSVMPIFFVIAGFRKVYQNPSLELTAIFLHFASYCILLFTFLFTYYLQLLPVAVGCILCIRCLLSSNTHRNFRISYLPARYAVSFILLLVTIPTIAAHSKWLTQTSYNHFLKPGFEQELQGYHFFLRDDTNYLSDRLLTIRFNGDNFIEEATYFFEQERSYLALIVLAEAYKEKNQSIQKEFLLNAYHYVPGRITARYRLFQYYLDNKDSLNARAWARETILGYSKDSTSAVSSLYKTKATIYLTNQN